MSTIPSLPPASAAQAAAPQASLARTAAGFEAPERKTQPLPPVEGGPAAADLRQRTGAIADERPSTRQPSAAEVAVEADPAPTRAAAMAATHYTPAAVPRFRLPFTTAVGVSDGRGRPREEELQAALKGRPRPGLLVDDAV